MPSRRILIIMDEISDSELSQALDSAETPGDIKISIYHLCLPYHFSFLIRHTPNSGFQSVAPFWGWI